MAQPLVLVTELAHPSSPETFKKVTDADGTPAAADKPEIKSLPMRPLRALPHHGSDSAIMSSIAPGVGEAVRDGKDGVDVDV